MSSGRAQGSTPYLNAAVADTPVLVKAGKIALASFNIYNPSNANAYVRFYDAAVATDVTAGTTVPDYVVGGVTLGFIHSGFSRPIQFTKGMVIAAATTAADSGHVAPNVALVVALGLST